MRLGAGDVRTAYREAREDEKAKQRASIRRHEGRQMRTRRDAESGRGREGTI